MERLLAYDSVITPLGPLILGASATALHSAAFGTLPTGGLTSPTDGHPVLALAKQQVQEYFNGQRKEFDIPLCLEGTPFQKKVWSVLQRIEFGQRISYQEQAKMMGEPSKSRAVGGANGKNPICLIVPCHRVVRKEAGNLGGYGYGLHAKQYLLDWESGICGKGRGAASEGS